MGSQLEFMGSLWTALEHSTKGPGVFLKLMGGLRKHCKTIGFSYVFSIWRFLERSRRSGEEILEDSWAVLRGPWGVSWGSLGGHRGTTGMLWATDPFLGPGPPPLGARSLPLGVIGALQAAPGGSWEVPGDPWRGQREVPGWL